LTSFILTCSRHPKIVNLFFWIACIVPALHLSFRYYTNSMGPNPYEFLMNTSGHCAIIFFIISYAIVPIRRWATSFCRLAKFRYGKRLSDWNFLIYNRRMLGLNAFYYTLIHVFVYLYFELDFDIELLIYELRRYFILVGWAALIILILLAVTSPKWMQKRLKQKWKKIHRLVDILVILLPLHVYMQSSIPDTYFWTYLFLCAALLVHRVIVLSIPYFLNARDNGEEVHR